jgi:hypothetical protein
MIILTEKQKKFLFDKEYVTYKTLDAVIEPGWEKYFINNYIWKLANTGSIIKDLILIDKNTKTEDYSLGLILPLAQFNELLEVD